VLVEEHFDEAFRHTDTAEIEDEEIQPNTSEQKTCMHDLLVEVEDFIINFKRKT